MYRYSVLLVFLFALFSNCLFAQDDKWRLAYVKDKDGFTYVRQFASVKSDIVDTVKAGEIIRCLPVDSGAGYYPVIPMKRAKIGEPITGYMYKTRIVLIDSLPDSVQARTLHKIFNSYINAYNKTEKDTTKFKKWYDALDKKAFLYICSLNLFESYFQRTKDTLLLMDFFTANYGDDGAYGEISSATLVKCLTNNETIFLAQLKKMKSKIRQRVVNNTIFGLQSIYGDKPKGEGGKRLQYLENKLNAIAGK